MSVQFDAPDHDVRPASFSAILTVLAVLAGFFFILPSLPVQAAPNAQGRPAELRVLATTFPVYLFTRNVTQSRPYVRVDLLVPAQSGCPHDFAPSPHDLQKLAQAQVLVMNGLGLENFLTASLKKINAQVTIIDSSAGIAPLPLPQGMLPSSHAGHGHGAVNPHLFAGPQQAAAMVYNIAKGLARVDPEGAAAYRAAAEAYAARLLSVGRRLAAVGAGAPRKGIVLQHDALAYLAHDAGLDVVDVIQESEDVQPSAARIMALVRRVREEKPVLIVSEPQYSDKPALTLARETGVPAASLDPVASGPADAPLSYYEAVMAANCQILERYFDQR
ncbi:zinc ABC transporter substrate-binding protein [Desulfovibrio sp. PG-178-WT-4]|uniref:Zinc ABC transporter substrate-binding protein n=1 Tax=Desulfovibrio porci TaxID=2605782 RepID=A0A6L5XL22_9BACT|nr:zinc ABC transporter substrate-binding protein [Desulfovibrio porci]MSS27788.1 zinc ABC transporter substrate-binding protein [Desulfovibrio porci]